MKRALNFFICVFASVAILALSACDDANTISNKSIAVSVSAENGITFVEKQSGVSFTQVEQEYKIANIQKKNNLLQFDIHAEIPLKATLSLVSDTSFELRLKGEGNLTGDIKFPSAWKSQSGDVGIYPFGNGFAFPVEKKLDFCPKRSLAVSGMRWSMGLIGLQRGNLFLIGAIEKPFDAAIYNVYNNGLMQTSIAWIPEMKKFGYERAIRFFVDTKLSSAMAQYRAYRESMGYVKALSQKAKERPHLTKIRGAANVWMWDENRIALLYARAQNPNAPVRDARKISAEMKSLGMDKILWNNFEGETAEDCEHLKTLGFLVGKYDIYRDVLPADIADKIIPYRVDRSVNTKYWPHIVRVDADGKYVNAWKVHGLDGKMYPQHSVCEICAYELTQKNVPADLAKVKYSSRLIDVQAGTALMECYSDKHKASRSTSAKYIAMQNEYLASLGLVRGVEVGHEVFVSTYDFSEGMTSPGYFRVPQAGRRMTASLKPSEMPEEKTFGYMLNPQYRIPLFELAYHDCAVNYFYWGQSNCLCPDLMFKFDAFSTFYGYPPIYSLDVAHWNKLKDRIAQSYHRCVPIVEKIAFERMIDFEYLSADKKVQKTTFSNGISLIGNFSDSDFRLKDGSTVKSWSVKEVKIK